MARPGFAKNLPKSKPSYENVRQPRTKLPDPKLQPPDRPGKPETLDLAAEKWGRRLQTGFDQDMKFESLKVGTNTTYFKRYVLAYKATNVEPLALLYCNYCWNRWAVISMMAMDKYTLVRFLRGQCCPSCRDDPSRKNINDGLHRIGPSKYFIEQAQRLGLRTERFPYLKPEEDVRFKDIWSINAANVARAQTLWEAVRPLVPSPVSEM